MQARRSVRWWQRDAPNLVAAVLLLVLVSIVYANSFRSGWVLDHQSLIPEDRWDEAAGHHLQW
jgi:hypothetical protein